MDTFEKEGEIVAYEDLGQRGFEFDNDKKRIFIFDSVRYRWFIMLNPWKKTYIKCFYDENVCEITKILKIVNDCLGRSGFEGIFEKFHEKLHEKPEEVLKTL